MHNHKSVHKIRINKKGQQKEEKLLTNLNRIRKMMQCVTQWYQKNNNFELISQIQQTKKRLDSFQNQTKIKNQKKEGKKNSPL